MNILITGGLGFIGSNLATKLSIDGHKITIIDNLNPMYGGNIFNLFDANKSNIEIINGDVRDKDLLKHHISDKDTVFHLAAQVSYIDSLNMVYDDSDVNAVSTLNILESIRSLKKTIPVFFTSSRLVYGKMDNLANEKSHTNPLSIYGIHKLTSERYLDIYHKNFGIPYVIMRLSNPYGIKQQMKHSKYSMTGWFIRQAMEGKTINIFGDGNQMRDYIYIEDIIASILLIFNNDKYYNNIYNIGCGKSIMFKEMVTKIINVVNNGKVEYVDWPNNYEKNETGDFEMDISKITSLGWKPSFTFEDGIIKTYDYYKKYKEHYFI